MEDGAAKITDESGRILLDHLALDRVYKLVETKFPESYGAGTKSSEYYFLLKGDYGVIVPDSLKTEIGSAPDVYTDGSTLSFDNRTLTEVDAPAGYVIAEPMKIKVEEVGGLQFFIMKDDVTRVQISKLESGTDLFVEGATLAVFDENDIQVACFETGDKPCVITKLPAGEYTLKEVEAPEGYELAEDMEIVIEETAELQEFTTSDKPKKPEAPEKPEDKPKPENGGSEDDNAPAPGQGGLPNTGAAAASLALITAAAVVIITGRKKK